jgi:hypothetical protein
MQHSPRWLTISEAARRSRRTHGHIRNLLFTGRLKGEQIGGPFGRWMVDLKDFQRYLRTRREFRVERVNA